MNKISLIIVVACLGLLACGQANDQDAKKDHDQATQGGDAGMATKPDDAKPEDAKPATPKSYDPSPKPAGWKAPDRVKVQHILVGVKASPRPVKGALPVPEAKALAESLCDRIRAGEDIDALMKQYSGDPGPGIYSMTMRGPADMGAGLFMRSGMAAAFGDVSYALEVGECAIAAYDPNPNPRLSKSPFGFHVIKRLE